MPALQVRDCPQDLYDDLKRIAAREERSLSQQTLHILKSYVADDKRGPVSEGFGWQACERRPRYGYEGTEEDRQKRIEKRKETFRKIDELHRKHDLSKIPVPDGYESDAEMIRAMREERTDRIIEAIGELS